MKSHSLSPIVIPLAFLLLSLFFAAPGLYWRDAGEFLLSGVFLDIAHPPGFPTYGSFANLISFLPFGPLAWRVNIVSALFSSAGLAAAIILFKALRRKPEEPLLSGVILAGSFLPLLLSPAFLRQSGTAEVYSGYAALLLLSVLFMVQGLRSRDLRCFAVSAFLIGLGLGMHVATALAAPAFLLLVSPFALKRPATLIPILLAGILGLLIFSYLPIRAAADPPLNTGDPSSIERFAALVTDARDRHLRPEVISGVGGLSQDSFGAWLRVFADDLSKLAEETSWGWLVCGVLGLLLLVRQNPLVGGAVLWLTVSPLLFFHGWQPDPWIGSMLLLACGTAFFFHSIAQCLEKTRLCVLLLTIFLLFSAALSLPSAHLTASTLRSTELPDRTTASVVQHIPRGGVFLHEQSFFLLTALRELEGLRDDIIPIYLPRLLFPHYFSSERFCLDGACFDSSAASSKPTVQNWENISSLLSTAATERPLFVEPVPLLNSRLHPLARLEPGMLFSLQPGLMAAGDDRFEEWIELAESAKRIPEQQSRNDALSFFEAKMVGAADLLAERGELERAIQLIQNYCGGPEDRYCSPKSFMNLALYQQRLQEMRGGK